MCSGSTGTISVSGANTYTWNTSQNLSSTTTSTVFSTTQSTETYTVFGTDMNSCSNYAITTISVTTTPTISVFSSSNIICPTKSATLIVSGANNYLWSPSLSLSTTSNSTTIATPITTTTYNVIGSNSNCTDTTQIVITVTVNPIITVNSSTICSGNTSNLVASGAISYTWSPSTYLNNNNSSNVNSTPPSSVIYTVSGSSSLGCISSSNSSVTVIPTPSLNISSTQSIICIGKTTTLYVSGANAYSWLPSNTITNTNGNTTIASPSTSTTYSVIGSNGVSPYICYNLKTIDVLVNPTPTIGVNPPLMFCEGKSSVIYATGANTYTWYPLNGVKTPHNSSTIIKPNTSGIYIYTVTGTNIYNCSSTETVQVTVNPLPLVYAGEDTTIDIGSSLVLNGIGDAPVGFISSSDGVNLNCNYCPTVSVSPINNVCYILEGISSFGCVNRDEICVKINKDWDIFIPNAFTPNNDGINDTFTPVGFGIDEIKLSIYNRWGVEIFKSNKGNIGWNGKHEGNMCEQGIYTYMIEIVTMSGENIIKTGNVLLLSKIK